ncbi:MAG: hypothetical protein JSS99_09955 [Actinobacteria bacterium]|nr:hypothetical protein [Actinomycetota bacterium]
MTHDDHTEHVDPPAALRALDDVVAPDRLRLAVAGQVADARRAQTRERRLRGRLGGLLAAAGAVAAALVVLGLFAGSLLNDRSSAPNVRAVAPVALRAPTAPAPAARPGGELLAAQAGPIAFPTWTRVGWRAVGTRRDTIRGHEVRTVFYADAAGRRIGYAIADAPLPVAGGRLVTRGGAQLRVLASGATAVVTWRRDGRTCVLAGRGVPVGRLLTLAGYAA